MADPGDHAGLNPAGAEPGLVLPAGAWDCHIHVFPDPREFPFAPGRRYTPGVVEPGDALALLRRLGAAHAVIQHASPYGGDNASLVWSVAALAGVAAGVAACPSVDIMAGRDPADWSSSGIAGFRLHDGESDRQTAAVLSAAGSWLAGSRMHLDLHVSGERAEALVPVIADLGVPVVLDHFAGIPPERGQLPQALKMLMDQENVWLKLSAAYRVRGLMPDGVADAVAVLMDQYPTRCLWGSDWPHTPPHPDDPARRQSVQPFRNIDTVAEVTRLAAQLTDDQKQLLFTENPARLYGWALAPHGLLTDGLPPP
ncbi:MAG: amidohydrolase family protein [Rhodospirillales bacterium]